MFTILIFMSQFFKSFNLLLKRFEEGSYGIVQNLGQMENEFEILTGKSIIQYIIISI